ncbi:MAG: cysteine desulfurase family protein [Janthinobacterium lividum]
MPPIYLDNNATTKPDPRVVEAMLPYLTEMYGNAASRSHAFGWSAEEAVAKARRQAAALLGSDPREIVWTSGATESNNLALKGVMEQADPVNGGHLVTAVTEHKAILDTAKHLEHAGHRVTYLSVDSQGRIDLKELEAALTEPTNLVSIMMGSNEIGTLQPIAEIGALCRARSVLFHTDATQSIGKMPVNVETMPIDLLSFTAHKMHGPKGVGALYVRRRAPRVRLTSQMDGGGHEHGMRSGTLNVPGIVGFGKACEICQNELLSEQARLIDLRDRLIHGILDTIDGTQLNGHPTERLPHNVNIAFEGVEGDALLTSLPEVALSTGSACSSESLSPSYVLKAIGLSDALAYASLRFGVSRFTTDEEIEYILNKLPGVVAKLRALSPNRTPSRVH